MQKNILYQDIPLDFKSHPITGKINLLKNDKAIAQSIKNLVLTNKYEILFNSDIFSNVTYTLFQIIDSGDLALLKVGIQTLLEYNEKRVTVLNVSYREEITNNGFTIDIEYVIENSTTANSISIFLERIR